MLLNPFFCHTIFIKIRERRKPYAKKMHVYSGEMIISAAPITSVFEKLKYKKWNGFDMAEEKNINLCLNSCSFCILFLLSEHSGEAGFPRC